MTLVETTDVVIWAKGVHGDDSLRRGIIDASQGALIRLEFPEFGVAGTFMKMKNDPSGRPTNGIRPTETTRKIWREIRAAKRGASAQVQFLDQQYAPTLFNVDDGQPKPHDCSTIPRRQAATFEPDPAVLSAGSTLLVGFDAAWTSTNSGAIVGVLRRSDGTFRELGLPFTADYREAEAIILTWQAELMPATTMVLVDQPTIVTKCYGQRPVEDIVGALVSRRGGGMQPANTSKAKMFGTEAPVWSFLNRFGGPADPFKTVGNTWVFETYPVLAMIALLWTLPGPRPSGRLPKYNPERRSTFSITDWKHVCLRASGALRDCRVNEVGRWIDRVAINPAPRKNDQDRLDACLCLLVALYLAEPTTVNASPDMPWRGSIRRMSFRGRVAAPPARSASRLSRA
jgi:predicted RNase H-like nuclease